ncbi:hypothetical protein BKA62DRAFT_770548 [Auriculariales sp. MPI-PUGE-AT-0066]|nr:hypothetical protein BKA62DRAFT_770548 [Auriculariales sp. MPI-PUGE-AT-0066]
MQVPGGVGNRTCPVIFRFRPRRAFGGISVNLQIAEKFPHHAEEHESHNLRSLPETFSIGFKHTSPLVSIDEVKAHLLVLGAFNKLKLRVTHANAANGGLEAQDAWTVFLCRAVHRFQLWIESVQELPQAGYLPPLDVLMVWHSYMLNPFIYEEDSKRMIPRLAELEYAKRPPTFPSGLVARSLNLETLELNVAKDVRDVFEYNTRQAFDMPLVTSTGDTLAITCPCCEKHVVFEWPWLMTDGTGWAQRQFAARCPACNSKFDHEAYGVRKLCNELDIWRSSRAGTFFLAGTAVPESIQNTSGLFMQQIFRGIAMDGELSKLSAVGLGRKFQWKMEHIIIWSSTQPGGQAIQVVRRIYRILSHYRFPGPFSVELTGAVMRQASFIQKMFDLGWTKFDRLEQDPSMVLRSIARYHAFLDMIEVSSDALNFTPTLDIDLAWHTHQLNAKSYRVDTVRFIHRPLNHDDRVEEGEMTHAWDVTAQTWHRRFGVPYSVCGCLIPEPDSSTSRALRGIQSKLAHNDHDPVPKNKRPDLITADHGDQDATHPSEHNSVVAQDSSLRERQTASRTKHDESLARRQKHVTKGKADAWTVLQHRRGEKHEEAFSKPVSYWGVSPQPYGNFGFGGASCGSGNGSVVASQDGRAFALSQAACSSAAANDWGSVIFSFNPSFNSQLCGVIP